MNATHPSIFLGAEPGPSRRSLDQLRTTIDSAYGAQLWETVRQGAEESVGTDPLLPGTALPGRPAEQVRHANADNTICQAVVRRLLRDSLVHLITGEERFRQDALGQMEALFDAKRWPQWLDFAHEMFEADLRHRQPRARRAAAARRSRAPGGRGRHPLARSLGRRRGGGQRLPRAPAHH
ncbi:MAG: hypothetical protein OXC31_29295, partial [Spirochaetaceae bacterium]|nr:hypothetical protein [Spirochaetaceae bacterium]